MFVRSERLNSEAVVQFVRALCAVSLQEIGHRRPRVFALTKIVEIAHFNMDRIRLVRGALALTLTLTLTLTPTVGAGVGLRSGVGQLPAQGALSTAP